MCEGGSGEAGSGGSPGEYAGDYDFSAPQGIAIDEALDGPVTLASYDDSIYNDGAIGPQGRSGGMFGGFVPEGQFTTTPGLLNLGGRFAMSALGATPLAPIGLLATAARLAGAQPGTDQDFAAAQGGMRGGSGEYQNPMLGPGLIGTGITSPQQASGPMTIASRFGPQMAIGQNYRS